MLSDALSEYTLPGVLHFLQAEWRRFERERNEWAIEKAELKARVTVLEGEKGGLENIQSDLVKRIKMLEFALRQERKQNGDGSSAQSTNAVSAQLVFNESPSTAPVPGNTAESPESADNSSTTTNAVSDRVRSRSREVLKTCLDEINSLLSTPNRLPMTRALSASLTQSMSQQRLTKPTRKLSKPIDSDMPAPATTAAPAAVAASMAAPAPQSITPESASPPAKDLNVPENVDEVAMMTNAKKKSSKRSTPSKDESIDELSAQVQKEYNLSAKHVRESMKRTNQSFKSVQEIFDLGDTQVLNKGERVMWKTRQTIRGHLDSVRALACHPTEKVVVSGSDDGTIKVWDLIRKTATNEGGSNKAHVEDVEPIVTYRGHLNVITSVIVSAEHDVAYSSSLDATICAWRLPPDDRSAYSRADPVLHLAPYIGHTDAIWDLSLHGSFLGSASADGTVRIWDTRPDSETLLKGSWTFDGPSSEHEPSVGATSLDFVRSNPSQMAVAYINAKIGIYDVATGNLVLRLSGTDDRYDGSSATQINTIITHHTDPLVVTAHEDRQIKLFDVTTGKCEFSMNAHPDGVTCLDIDPSGRYIVSGGHDMSLRIWDLRNDKTCVQEFSAHRRKCDEGVLSVQYHPTHSYLVSGGADGIVKVYQPSSQR